MSRVFVIGATGRVGRQVVAQLQAGGVRVRALVRDPLTAGLPPHVVVVRGDLTLPESLDEGLDKVDALFLVWTAPPDGVTAALERIVRQARRIVFLSSPHKTPHPFFQGGQPNPVAALHIKVEQLIEASGCEWTFLRPGMFASNASMWWAAQIRAGKDVIRWPYAAAATAPIHERDIAAVAVRVLCEEGHVGAEYVLTGPESLSQADQISQIGEAIGRPLRMEDISPDEARRELKAPLFVVDMLLGAWSEAMGQAALVTSTVAKITGVPARTFREWVADHAGDFRA